MAPDGYGERRRLLQRRSTYGTDFSFTPEAEPTSIDQKNELIDQEIDRIGMGRYQWTLWLFCGLGYLVDLQYGSYVGLVLGPVTQEFGVPGDETANITIAFSIGLTVGAFVWGYAYRRQALIDNIGRKWVFTLTYLTAAIFGLALGFCRNYTQFLLVSIGVGLGVGGNIPVATTICLEFMPTEWRSMLPLLSLFQPIGVIINSLLAFLFIPNNTCRPSFDEANPLPSCRIAEPGAPCCSAKDNMGWRYLSFTLGGVTLLVFLLRFPIFVLQESPKFLIEKGRDQEAQDVLRYVAKYNGDSSELTQEDLDACENDDDSDDAEESTKHKIRTELKKYRKLFKNRKIAMRTILIWITYMADFSGFTLASQYLPLIVSLKNAGAGLSLSDTYKSYIIIYSPGIIGVAIGAYMYRLERFGQKWTLIISAFFMGLSILVFSAVNNLAANTALNAVEYISQSAFNAVLYGMTPGLFPASIRGTASGLASVAGRLASVISPAIVENTLIPKTGLALGDAALNYVLWFSGGITLICVFTVYFLPV